MNDEIKNDGANYRTELLKNGAIAFVPSGNSMWPILKNRKQSVIAVKKTEKLRRFDVALYERDNGAFVLHRVMKSTDYGYVICGDSQFSLEKVREEQVFGVMSGFYSGKKFVSCKDEKYAAKVEKWYGRPTLRKIRLKFFYFRLRVKGFIKRVMNKLTGANKKRAGA